MRVLCAQDDSGREHTVPLRCAQGSKPVPDLERELAGYFGSEAQRRLQSIAEANVDFINTTEGACQAGRFLSCDDPKLLGWERIKSLLDRDGVFGFRLISPARADEVKSHVRTWNCRFDTWDVFVGDREAALAASEAILARGLPDGLTELESPREAEDAYMVRIQSLMAATGVVPFSGSFLAGALGPVATVVVSDSQGAIAAVAHGYMGHNAHSPFHRYAWGGLVAVAEAWRGKGIGSYINARMVVRVFHELGATHVYELVSTTNIPSRRMVEACGLRLDSNLICGMAVTESTERFTR